MIGLAGAHRTGKSTLAQAFAEKHNLIFVQTSASAIFKELGYDPAVTYDFGTRLKVQEELLKRFDRLYADHPEFEKAITDRTPLDMLAYTIGDVNGETLTPELEERLAKYVQACIDVTNRRFTLLLVVQPGIPVKAAEGKASLSAGYIEHLNSLILGFSVDERIKPAHFYIPRHMTSMTDRMAALEFAVKRAKQKAIDHRQELHDGELH